MELMPNVIRLIRKAYAYFTSYIFLFAFFDFSFLSSFPFFNAFFPSLFKTSPIEYVKGEEFLSLL